MVIEVAKNIYSFPIPLPDSPLKILNCYIIKGDGRNLMVDVGYNTQVGLDAVTAAFHELGISFADTDIFLTHLHGDHTGMVEVLKHKCGNIYISDLDAGHVDKNGDPAYWLEYFNKQQHMGLPESDRFSYEKHPAYAGGNMTPCDLVIVTEGMRFDYGGYNFEAIDIRGHTPGQMGLYDKEASLLLCGDHILNKITPNINLWDFKADYLGLFLKNLKKVRALHVQTLLPAHRTPIPDANARIDELLAHHDRRLARILEILSSGKSSVYEVAMDLEWDYLGGYFGDFPTEQKWFAANEVFAHLEHLRTIGKVERKIEWPAYLYYVK